jgi:hypothetical protein
MTSASRCRRRPPPWQHAPEPPDIRRDVDAAGADPLDVLRHPDDAVAVRALQVRLRHQAGNFLCIGWPQSHLLQRAGNEVAQPVEADEVGTACLHGVHRRVERTL